MEATDLTKILKDEHQGKWVVYSPTRMEIFSYDQDPIKAAAQAKAPADCDDLRLMKVLPYDQSFSPFA